MLLLSAPLQEMKRILSVQRREKGSNTKCSVPWTKFVKLYNSGMGGIDLMDQRTAADRLDRKLFLRFYLRIFFDLMDIACVNNYLIYNMKHPNKQDIGGTCAISINAWHFTHLALLLPGIWLYCYLWLIVYRLFYPKSWYNAYLYN